MDASDYLAQLQELLPRGPAWPRDAASWLTKQLQAWADEFARVHGRAVALLDEGDPRETSELLDDFERITGLPDPCVTQGEEQSSAERREAVVARLTMMGAQSRAYFIAVAADLGYAITITELDAFTVDDDVDEDITGEAWDFAWQVNAAEVTITELTVMGSVDDPLAWWGNEALECVLRKFKPAHTQVIFSYT